MVANVSPASLAFGETLSTLKFAQRAKAIKNRVTVNEGVAGNALVLQAEVRRLRAELTRYQGACCALCVCVLRVVCMCVCVLPQLLAVCMCVCVTMCGVFNGSLAHIRTNHITHT